MLESHSMDQNNLRRAWKILTKVWIGITSALGSLLLIASVWLIVLAIILSNTSTETPYPTTVRTQGGADQVAVLKLSGVIVEDDLSGDPFSSGIISAERVKPMLDHFQTNDSIKAVVIRINSPGGAVVASDELSQQITQLAASKPVVISFGDVSASGGYYISAGASKILANPATITGSIGVIAQFPEITGLFNTLGIDVRTFKSGQYKDIGSPTRPMTEAERAIIQSVVDQSYEQFISVVAAGRDMELDNVRRIADGRILTGLQAQEAGLVDEMGNLEDAIEDASELAQVSDPTVVEYTSKSFIEQLLSSSINKISPTAQITNQLSPQLQPGLYYLMSW